jgi:hypothetical protein
MERQPNLQAERAAQGRDCWGLFPGLNCKGGGRDLLVLETGLQKCAL